MKKIKQPDNKEDNHDIPDQIRKEVMANNPEKRRTEAGLPPENPPELNQEQVFQKLKELTSELSSKYNYILGFVLYGSFADPDKAPRKDSDIDMFIVVKEDDVEYIKKQIARDDSKIFDIIQNKFSDTSHFKLDRLSESWMGIRRVEELFAWNEEQGCYVDSSESNSSIKLGKVKIILK